MYVTRALSWYRENPSALSLPPPEGPYSGYLLFHDREAEENPETCFFGLIKDSRWKTLPFPSDRVLSVEYTTSNGESSTTYWDKTIFIPVLGKPLSSNLYYVVKAEGNKSEGLVHTCSTEDDKITCCFYRCIKDVNPIQFIPNNPYQQMDIIDRHHKFTAKSVCPDGFAPAFLRRKGWRVYRKDLPKKVKLTKADGINTKIRSMLPDFYFLISEKASATSLVGEWYCPFMFIREYREWNTKKQIEESCFYKMTLEQKWVEIFQVEKSDGRKEVLVDTMVNREVVLLGNHQEHATEMRVENNGMMILRGKDYSGVMQGVELSMDIVLKMRQDQKVETGEEIHVRVERVFNNGNNMWTRFACYILEEKYVLRRMDGSLVLTYAFQDLNQISPKWE